MESKKVSFLVIGCLLGILIIAAIINIPVFESAPPLNNEYCGDQCNNCNNSINLYTKNITITGVDLGGWYPSPFYVYSSEPYKYQISPDERFLYGYAKDHQRQLVVITYKQWYENGCEVREIIDMHLNCDPYNLCGDSPFWIDIIFRYLFRSAACRC